MQPLQPQTINSHLHLLTEILARAVREGLIPRNPAVGEDLRLEVRREKRYGLELDEAMSLVEAAGTLDQRPWPSDELRRQIVAMRGNGNKWKAIAAELDIGETTAMYHAKRAAARRCRGSGRSSRPSRSPGCASANCARSTASTSISPVASCACSTRRRRRACVASTSTTISRTNSRRTRQRAEPHGRRATPAFLNARGRRWTRHAIAQHVIPPSLEEANRQRAKAGFPEIREVVTPHTLRYTYIASLFAAGADQEYVADQVGHEDVTTTNRIYRYVLQRRRRGEIGRRRQLAMHESAADVGRSEDLPTRARES